MTQPAGHRDKPLPVSRRDVVTLAIASVATGVAGLPRPAKAQPSPEAAVASATGFGPERHGMSAFDDLAYPADFPHFAYVSPTAPKGGTLSQVGPATLFNQNFATFNSLNMFILRGDGPQGMELTFATLMRTALDEPDSQYGLAAESVAHSGDGLTYRFRLRPQATFHDGTPVTGADVVYSIETLKRSGHPILSQSLRDVAGAEAPDTRTVVVRFVAGRPRDLPLLVAGLPIFSKAYYATRTFDSTTLEAPLGSGPYKVSRFEVGRFIEYERVKDHWSESLPVGIGQNNFDRVRYEFYRDRDVAFEAFKGGGYLLREEFTSRTWSTGYDLPAVRDGRIRRDVLEDDRPSGAQGWFMNTRRAKFQDPRVREALILAFDFEWTNQNLMFGAYTRTRSFFENSDLMASGPPAPDELKLLEPFRGKVPDEVFGEPFLPPVSDGSGQDRRLLRRARDLLQAAGWTVQNGQLRNARGEGFDIEFLDFEPGLEPHTSGLIKNLRLLGINASIRRVDGPQYQSRVNSFDYDMVTRRYAMSSTPGEGLRQIFSSQSADVPGSSNLSGIKDPAVDALVQAVLSAETRVALTTAVHALDRVVRSGRYWIPHWYKGTYWMAYWDAYARPEKPPRYGRGVLESWWWDAAKAAKSGVRG